MKEIKQSGTSQTLVFLMVDPTDFKTEGNVPANETTTILPVTGKSGLRCYYNQLVL